FQAEDGIRDLIVTGVQTCALPISLGVLRSSDPIDKICDTLARTRPTAVNLFWAIDRMRKLYESLEGRPVEEIRAHLVAEARQIRSEERRVGKECRSRR